MDPSTDTDEPPLKQSYTEQDARDYVALHLEDIMDSYRTSKDVPDFLRGTKMEEVWKSGCWLNSLLKKHGASEKEVSDIGFAHGQRAFGSDPWPWAVAYLNEFIASRQVADRPGAELADRIMDDVGWKFQTMEEIIAELNPSDEVLCRWLQGRGVFLGSECNVREQASLHMPDTHSKEDIVDLMKKEQL